MGILSAVTALTFARALDAAAEMALPTRKVRRSCKEAKGWFSEAFRQGERNGCLEMSS